MSDDDMEDDPPLEEGMGQLSPNEYSDKLSLITAHILLRAVS